MTLLKNPIPWAVLALLAIVQSGWLQWQLIHREPVVVERVIEMSPPLQEEPEPSTRDKMTGPSAYELGQDDARAIPAAVASGKAVQGYDSWARTEEQGVMLARLWVSELSNDDKGMLGKHMEKFLYEKGTAPMAAHLLTHTVNNSRSLLVRETREPVQGWLGVMRELSPYVTGKYEPKRPRQHWTSTLPETGEEAPAGWVPERDGDWRLYARSWVMLRKMAVSMWTRPAQLALVPGGGIPRAWDMEGYESTRKRLCKLDNGNGEPLAAGGNWFWGFQGDPACLPVEVASR